MSTTIALIGLFVGLIWGVTLCIFSSKFRGKELVITFIVGVIGWIAASIAVWIVVGTKVAGWCWLTPAIACVVIFIWYKLSEIKHKTPEESTPEESTTEEPNEEPEEDAI